MLLNETQIVDMLKILNSKTTQDDVYWQADRQRYYTNLNPNVIFSISCETPTHCTVKIIEGDDNVIGILDKTENAPFFGEMKQLYAVIEGKLGAKVFSDLMESIKGPGVIGRLDNMSAGPSDDQISNIRKKMQGAWGLDYTFGKETVIIDPHGNYTVFGKDKPSFRLKIIGCNDSLTKAEIIKEHHDTGKMKHIEVLTLSDNEMTGVAKHDQHRLKYTRTSPFPGPIEGPPAPTQGKRVFY